MSIRFQADNDLKFGIVKAVRRREPAIDFMSAQEAGLDGLPDPELLDRAAREGRVVVSHDRRTMIDHFHLVAGKSSPGLLIVSRLWSTCGPFPIKATFGIRLTTYRRYPGISFHAEPSRAYHATSLQPL